MMNVMDFINAFQALLREKPRYSVKQVQSENSKYADTAVKSKNCYYSFCTFYCEDVYYARFARKCTSCSDISFCVDCQWCLSCSDCVGCYDCNDCQYCNHCIECQYCTDCYSCEHCFGCIGLRRAKYHIFNQKYRPEDYKKLIKDLDQKDPASQKVIKERIEALGKVSPRLNVHITQSEDCFGDNITQSKSCKACFDVFTCEDCLYNIECNGNKDCFDLTVCFEDELCSNSVQSPLNYNCDFLLHSDQCTDSQFCAYSKNLKNCFGCVYLQNKEFYILNKAYSEEDYHKEVKKIKKILKERQKYTLDLYFISEYEQNRLKNEEDPIIGPLSDSFYPFMMPSDEKNTDYDKKVVICAATGKKFLITPQEQAFYARKGLPLPVYSPAYRHAQRMALRNERQLYKRVCDFSSEEIFSTIPPESPYKVYAQKHFWEQIG